MNITKKKDEFMINLENAEKIMDNYMPLIYATVKRFNTFDLEEAVDEAKMILIESILVYDENKGTFGNYLKIGLITTSGTRLKSLVLLR